MRPAVFLDRDGTIIEHVHYLRRPKDVVLIPGAARAIARLSGCGYLCVVASNQSVIAKGLLDPQKLEEIHERVNELLAEAARARLDGWYVCPEERRSEAQDAIDHPDRKPGPGMLLRAAAELDIDLSRSWMVGDALSDVFAGNNAGCKGSILVRSGLGQTVDASHPAIHSVASDLSEAVEIILATKGQNGRGDRCP